MEQTVKLSSSILSPETDGRRARRGRGREAEIASSLRTIAHLERERDKQKALGRTALAEYTQARINAIQARIASYQP